jgi:hypothetical protein
VVVAQVVEHLPSKHEALSSIPSTEIIIIITTAITMTTIIIMSRHQWLSPVILATQEAGIRRVMVQSQMGQRVCKTQP